MNRLAYLAAGAVFGFILHQARVTDYDTITAMFRLQDLHLMGVMGVAIGVSAAGLWLLRRTGARAVSGSPIEVHPKPMARGVFVGGLVFGAGWALTGACPGTALSQVGEGKLYALFTVAGLVAGTLAYGLRRPISSRPERRPGVLPGA